MTIAAIAHLGFALGVPRRALEEIQAHAARQRIGSTAPIGQRPIFQRDYARARVRLRAARGVAMEALAAVVDAEDAATLEQRAELGSTIANAYATAVAVTEFAFRAGGASSLYRDAALQRCMRDAQAGAQHIVASDEMLERAGRAFLTGEDPGFL